MAYLYGDSSPFPLNENFIDTLRGTTDTCLELLQADESMELIRMQTEQEKKSGDSDLAGVERLAAALRAAMEPHQADSASPFLGEVYARLMSNAKSVFDGAARDVVSRRDSALLHMESRLAAERARVPQALERFLIGQQLPDTQWGVNWVVRGAAEGHGQAHARAVARTPSGLEATFELNLGVSALWARPFKVGDIKPELVIQLPRRGRWLDRGAALKEERLDRYMVTEVSLTPERCAISLRKGNRLDSPGLEFAIGGKEVGTTVRALDDQSGPEEPVLLEGLDGAAIDGLWEMLATRLRPLKANRVRLVQALLNGTPISDVDPSGVAKLLITAISPFVREMCRRSAVAGELALKREVEDGRREELFISVRELTDKFSSISPKRQAYFEDFGLVYDIPASPDPAAEEAARQQAPTGEMMVQGEMIVADEQAEATRRVPQATGPMAPVPDRDI